MNHEEKGVLERKLRPLFPIRKDKYHPAASDWARWVVANGGDAVSGQTLAAVSDFCRDLDLQGLSGGMRAVNLVAPDNRELTS